MNSKKGLNKGTNSLHLIFNLPDYVNRDSVTYYSYCFEESQNNLLQYAIAYLNLMGKTQKGPKIKKKINLLQ